MILYRHIRLDKNEPFYIGIGNDRRPYTKSNRNSVWKSIVSKTDYRVDILFDDLTLEEANEKEKEFILLYGRIDLGTGTLCNLTSGGQITQHSEETRKKISKRHKGRKGRPLSEEHKNKLIEVNTGRVVSEETKKKISLSNKGRKNSDEAIERMKMTLTGRKLSQEHIENISKSLKGKTLGRKHDDDSKKKMSESASNRKYKNIVGINKYHLSDGSEKFRVRYFHKKIRYYVGVFDNYKDALEALNKHKENNDELKINQ